VLDRGDFAPRAAATPPPGSGLFWTLSDVAAMTGRNLRRLMRAPDQVMFILISPIMFTLLFRYVFGGAIGGLGSINYVNYLIPGIAVQTAIFAAGTSGFALADDRASGFVERLRSLPMARSAVLAGRVAADTICIGVSLGIIVVVGLLVGFRPESVPGLLLGLLLLLTFAAATCFVFALVGLYVSNSQAVNAATFPVIFPLTFASSAFVPTHTMPVWLRGFAEHQPVTDVINAVRALTLGHVTPALRTQLFAGQSTESLVLQSLLWSAAIALVFGFLAVRRFNSTSS
jgi:ABC-2 type transport system permease protein/oleandomycin transport system permease protein